MPSTLVPQRRSARFLTHDFISRKVWPFCLYNMPRLQKNPSLFLLIRDLKMNKHLRLDLDRIIFFQDESTGQTPPLTITSLDHTDNGVVVQSAPSHFGSARQHQIRHLPVCMGSSAYAIRHIHRYSQRDVICPLSSACGLVLRLHSQSSHKTRARWPQL